MFDEFSIELDMSTAISKTAVHDANDNNDNNV